MRRNGPALSAGPVCMLPSLTAARSDDIVSKATEKTLYDATQDLDQLKVIPLDRAELIEKLKIAHEWVLRLTTERNAAEDRAARAEGRVDAVQKALSFTSAKLADIEGHHSFKAEGRVELIREIETLKERLRHREAELATIQSLNAQAEAHLTEVGALASAGRSAQHNEWLRKVSVVMLGYPRWWALMPKQWRLRREQRLLLRKGLFDAEGYLARYSDVLSSGMDPLRHYILHGMDENRSLGTFRHKS